MPYYILSVSNVKPAGGTDATSTKRFLIVVKDNSIAPDSLRNHSIEEVLKTKPAGIVHPISYSLEKTDIAGSAEAFGDLVASTKQIDVRRPHEPKG